MPTVDFDKSNPLERVAGETKRANQAFMDYALLGLARSIRRLHEQYSKRSADSQQKPPTESLQTLFRWSFDYGWVDRANAFDEIERSSKLAEIEADRQQWKEKREKLAKALFNKAAQALNNVTIDEDKKIKLSDATMAVAAALKELRVEMGDQVPDPDKMGEVVIRIVREDLPEQKTEEPVEGA